MAIAGVLLKEPDDFVGDAVGPGSHGEADDVVLGEGLVIERFQPVIGCVGVGEGLKVGDELLRPSQFPVEFLCPCYLFRHRRKGPLLSQFRAPTVTVDAPPGGDRSVAVGAGESGIDLQFVDLVAEGVDQVTLEVVIPFCIVPECGLGHGVLIFLLSFAR